MHMTMTMMRPGLFFQREGPGSEPGNSLLCPDEAPRSSVCRVLGMLQCRASLLHKVIPGYAFIDSAHGCSVVTNRPACPFEESEITVPHKSRSPDAISKPSHPQYFHIKEHSQHKQHPQNKKTRVPQESDGVRLCLRE